MSMQRCGVAAGTLGTIKGLTQGSIAAGNEQMKSNIQGGPKK